MKKFMSGCGITALILIVVGLVMAIVASGIQGRGVISDVVEEVTHGYVHYNLGSFRDFGISIGENAVFDLDDDIDFLPDLGILSGDIDRYSPGNSENVYSLDIEVGGCGLYIRESGDDNFYVEAENTHKFQSYVSQGTLYVKESRQHHSSKHWSDLTDCTITIYVPEGFRFDEVEAEFGAGELDLGELYADELNLDFGAGQVMADYLEVRNAAFSVGAGEIDIDDMKVDNLEAEVGMGALYMTADIGRSIQAECSMGELDLTVKGSKTDFNYDIEASMGNVSIGRDSYAGLGREQTINNNARKTMELECAMGHISIAFTE